MNTQPLMDTLHLTLDELFSTSAALPAAQDRQVWGMRRHTASPATGVSVLIDRFADRPDAQCIFLRTDATAAKVLRLGVQGGHKVEAAAGSGWRLSPSGQEGPSYWLPQPPILRTQDKQGHILNERAAALTHLDVSADGLAVNLDLPADGSLDWIIWRFGPGQGDLSTGLESSLALERQSYFLWGSKVNVRLPAGLYHFLIHGRIYTDDFVWPRNWKFLSELDAYGLFKALTGLEVATGKALYGLLRRQVLYSVLDAQAEDGGWRHGEWTDLMETHLRLHNAAMLLLEAGLEESGDVTIRTSLERAAAFLAKHTDRTDLGAWFLHDSLETSAENMEIMRKQTRTPWIPSRTLGKSPCTKLILNTHLDAIVTMDRYRALTDDRQYDALLDSARAAASKILALRPAEPLYRFLYKLIALTLLPRARGIALPWPLRALKRLTWMYLWPNMHRVKRLWPRLVMPCGLIERHIAPLHFDLNYHPVNVMDVVRYWRRFPGENLSRLIDNALRPVQTLDLLQYWTEATNRQFAIVVWAEALYHLCLLKTDGDLRRQLAQSMLCAAHNELGLPAALLGADAESAPLQDRHPCPSPTDPRLRVANLSHGTWREILVVNPGDVKIELAWEANHPGEGVIWFDETGQRLSDDGLARGITAGGWVLGRAGRFGPTIMENMEIHA